MDVVSADAVEPVERFAFWRELSAHLDVPYELRCDPETERGFRAQARFSEFGPLQAMLSTSPPHSIHRTPRLIRRSDPEVFELCCAVRGGREVTQDEQRAYLADGDLMLFDPSRPFHEYAPLAPTNQALILRFPRAALPLPAQHLRQLSAVRIPGARGVGALSSQFLLQLARQLPGLGPAEIARVSVLTLDVLATALADALDLQETVPAHARRRTLLARIHAFIRENLGDTRLTPEAIAAAHHISLRYLHKLFRQEDHTVAAFIRARRLEQCRRELAEPHLATRPIHAIAARWGFTSASHFHRVFSGAYELSPSEYRRRHATVHAN